MESMSSAIDPVVPRTANLLACKQWWRVCFLYGDQQKYYRQVYSKAAAQRLALSTPTATRTTALRKTITTKTKSTGQTSDFNNENDSNKTSEEQTTEYDTIAIDFIETQLDEDAEDGVQDKHISTPKITNNNNLTTTTEQQQQKQQQTPVALFPLKCATTTDYGGGDASSSTLRKSKRLLRSLRGNRKGGGDTNDTCSTLTTNKKPTKQLRETLESLKNLSLHHALSYQQQQLQQQELHQKEILLSSHSRKSQNSSLFNEPTKQNAKHTLLDDPFLLGIGNDEDNLGSLIRTKNTSYTPHTAFENITKYFNLCTETTQETSPDSLASEDQNSDKPALPPKRKSGPTTSPQHDFKLSESDLEFLNLNLRNRSLPRNLQLIKDHHNISFTFKEEKDEESSRSRERDQTDSQNSATGNANE